MVAHVYNQRTHKAMIELQVSNQPGFLVIVFTSLQLTSTKATPPVSFGQSDPKAVGPAPELSKKAKTHVVIQ